MSISEVERVVMRPRRKVPEAKLKAVEEICQLIKNHKIVGLVRMTGIPARIVQKMRASLRGKATIKMVKKNLLEIALRKLSKEKPNITELMKYYSVGNYALILTDGDVFYLAKFLEENKMPAPAKVGQIAPKDVTIPEQNTGLPPGPIIGEFSAVALPTRIVKGQIAILKDTVIIQKGEKIARHKVVVLARLGILPFETGLTIEAAYDDGVIFTEKHLMMDVLGLLSEACTQSQSLAIVTNVVTPTTLLPLLAKAQSHIEALKQVIIARKPEALIQITAPMLLLKGQNQALALATEANIVTKVNAPLILLKAKNQVGALLKKITEINPDILPESLEKTVKEKEKKVEKKEEVTEEDQEEKGTGED